MLFKNGKKAGYNQVYDNPDALIDAASDGKHAIIIYVIHEIKCCPKRIITGNSYRVLELMQSVDINSQNGVGDTALIRACEGIKCLLLFKM